MIKTALIYFLLDYCIEKFSKQVQLNLSNPLDAIANATMLTPEDVEVGKYYDVMVFSYENFRDDYPSRITAPKYMSMIFYDCVVIRDEDGMITIKYEHRMDNAEFSDLDSLEKALEEINTGMWGSRVSVVSYDEVLSLIALEVERFPYRDTFTTSKSELIGAYKI